MSNSTLFSKILRFPQKVHYLWLLLFFTWTVEGFASVKYASPNGSSGNSGNSPSQGWSLAFALGTSSPLAAGDTLFLTDGVFEGNFTSVINGSAGKPIVIIAQNEGKAIIDVGKQRTSGTGLTISGSYTWFVGIRVTSSSVIRKSDESNGFAEILYESGIAVFGDNNKIINCWVYDIVGGGLELWRSGLNLEVYGSVIFNNGSQDLPRGTGHAMYIQHDQPSQPKVIENNFVFQNASQGINIFTSNPANRGVIVRRNVSFNTGVIATFNPFLFRPPHNLTIGSQSNVSHDIEVSSNIFYADLQGGRLSKNDVSNVSLGRNYSPNRDISFEDNVVVGGRNQVEFQSLERLSFQRNKLLNTHGDFFEFLNSNTVFPSSTWDSNVYSNIAQTSKPFHNMTFPEWKSALAFDNNSSYSTTPSRPQEVLITRNKYDQSRFHVTILNLKPTDQVELDFSEFEELKDASYEISDIQNPFDQSQRTSGIFNGKTIRFPMNWTKSLQPRGNMPFQAVHTDRTFGTFLVIFEKKAETPVDFPKIKESITLYLNSAGKAILGPDDFLVNKPAESFTYSSSRGFEFSCVDLGSNSVNITSKNTRTGEERTAQTVISVLDTIAPSFGAPNASFAFDPTVGKLALSPSDFKVVDLRDNCTDQLTLVASRAELTCADIFKDPAKPTQEFNVVLTATDGSGNSFSRTVKAIISNISESVKVSLSPSGSLSDGRPVELTLGKELNYTVLEWRKNSIPISGQTGSSLRVSEPGSYSAKLLLAGGCTVYSSEVEVKPAGAPVFQVKSVVDLVLDAAGSATLKPQDVFVTWPLVDQNLDISLGKSQFTCTDLGENEVLITIKNPTGQTWEEKTKVSIRDKSMPLLESKNFSAALDVTKGSLALKPENFLASSSDNCGITELTISKTAVTCQDLGKQILVTVRAVDASGNVSEVSATLTVTALESQKVTISGPSQFCKSEKRLLTLQSQASFEVIRWRKNGIDIPGQVGKTLEVADSGKYEAVIQYSGACQSETVEFEVKVLTPPSGEIIVAGNILTAPEGFSYQWIRDGEPIAGAVSRVFTADLSGEYTVELTSEAGCKARLTSVTLTISGIGGRPVREAVELKVYPNPASGRVTLELPDGLLASSPEILFYSSDGKNLTSSVQTIAINDTVVEISLNRIAKGTYLIWIVGDSQKSYFAKLIVVN